MPLKEATERVLQFENSIKRLDSLTKHINQNSSDIKTEIHASVSQCLEYLRCRELSLLNQVDQMLRAQEETLQRQQAKLSQALGILQTGLSMTLDGAVSERQLTSTLEKLKTIELAPTETPSISFKADHENLHESILTYGRLDGKGFPLMTVCGNQGNMSTSLSQHVEEYKDVEHCVFFKKSDEMKRDQTSAVNINFVRPQLSNRIEDWLVTKIPSTKSEDSKIPARLLPVAHPSNLTEPGNNLFPGLSSNSTTGSSSNRNWLSLTEQNADLKEEHGLEILNNSCTQEAAAKTRPIGTIDKSCAAFVQPIGTTLKGWLSYGSEGSSSLSSPVSKPAPTDNKMWLLQTCQQLTSLNDLKHKDLFHHIDKEPSSWLYSRSYKKQVTCQEGQDGANLFSHISKDKEYWLQKQSQTQSTGKNENIENSNDEKSSDTITSCYRKTCAKDIEEILPFTSTTKTPLLQLKDMCKANELCEDICKCVSKPDCYTEWLQEKSSVKNVVVPTPLFKPLSVSLHEWLSPVSQNHTRLATAHSEQKTSNLLNTIQDTNDSIWLMKPALSTAVNVNTTPLLAVKLKDNKEESNRWLQKARSRPNSTSSDLNISDWLMVTTEDNHKHSEGLDQDKDSEGWSICSDSNSICTDQYTKDIAAADEYFSKWLL